MAQAAALHNPDPGTQATVHRHFRMAHKLVEEHNGLCLDNVPDKCALIVAISTLLGKEASDVTIATLEMIKSRLPIK